MSWLALWGFLKQAIVPIVQVILEIAKAYNANQYKKLGHLEKEQEVKKNDENIRDVIINVDTSGLSDDEAFKPRKP